MLVLTGSVDVAETVAELVRVPDAVAATVPVIVMVAVAPSARLPRFPVTVLPAPVAVPWLAVAETKVTLLGSVSVTVTPVASDGPLLVTVSVYVIVCPATTGSGESVFAIDRSAC